MLQRTTLTLILFFRIISANTQSISFQPFMGTAFDLPSSKFKLGYGSHVYSYDTLSTFVWNEVVISERETDIPFPDVPKTTGFGIVFQTIAQIDSTACYEFVINSDDGSLLYINDSLVIDNGGNHKMQAVRDTFLIREGSYPIKIWYQQLYPTKYGMIFNASFAGNQEICNKQLNRTRKHFSLQKDLQFNTNEYALGEKAKQFLDSIAIEIIKFKPVTISFEGHTDNIGDFANNQILSLRRAEAVFNYLNQEVDFTGVEIKVKGYADSKPLMESFTEENRARNRRVEIIME